MKLLDIFHEFDINFEESEELSNIVTNVILPSEAAEFIHAHPTLSEAIGESLMSLSGKGLH